MLRRYLHSCYRCIASQKSSIENRLCAAQLHSHYKILQNKVDPAIESLHHSIAYYVRLIKTWPCNCFVSRQRKTVVYNENPEIVCNVTSSLWHVSIFSCPNEKSAIRFNFLFKCWKLHYLSFGILIFENIVIGLTYLIYCK